MRDSAKMNGIWVFCEQSGSAVRPVAHELLGKAAQLAKATGRCVSAVLLGDRMREQAEKLAAFGADSVLYAEGPALAEPLEESYAAELERLVRQYDPEALLLGATAFGRSLAPRLAARLQTGLTADCTGLEIDPETGLLLQTRPAFGGNLMATITCPEARPQMATVRPRVFSAPAPDYSRSCEVICVAAGGKTGAVELIEKLACGEEAGIGEADVLVSVGQGIGGAENIALAGRLAAMLGGTLASSRPLVDSGVMPYARQVGQTGKTISPRLYIACGISGAVQHMAGVAAENIVAINTDPDAPIFRYARWGVVADCGAFLREMIDRLSRDGHA